jgi:hypothetical protein
MNEPARRNRAGLDVEPRAFLVREGGATIVWKIVSRSLGERCSAARMMVTEQGVDDGMSTGSLRTICLRRKLGALSESDGRVQPRSDAAEVRIGRGAGKRTPLH